jgi:beta-glucosidase
MTPLFPFGYGLSYTTFEYGKPELNKTEIHNNENVKASVIVKNTGNDKGDEIIQLYIHDKVSSVTRPIMELKDFSRITLNPGESKKVEFTITPDKLQFYNHEMKRVVEPGEFEVLIGPSSDKVTAVNFKVID